MSAFIAIAALMALATLALLLRPLWRHTPQAAQPAPEDTREQLRQLDSLRASGTLTDAQAAEARARLEQRAGRENTPSSAPAQRPLRLLAVLSGFVVVVAAAGYALIGAPVALDRRCARRKRAMEPATRSRWNRSRAWPTSSPRG